MCFSLSHAWEPVEWRCSRTFCSTIPTLNKFLVSIDWCHVAVQDLMSFGYFGAPPTGSLEAYIAFSLFGGLLSIRPTEAVR